MPRSGCDSEVALTAIPSEEQHLNVNKHECVRPQMGIRYIK